MDIGEPIDYLAANAAVLSKQEINIKPNSVTIDPSAMVIRPCIFGKNVTIGVDSRIGPNVSIADGVFIGKGCRIENSILFAGAIIEDFSSVKNAILARAFGNSHGMRFWQADVLKGLGDRYDVSSWSEASDLYRVSGEKIMDLCKAALEYDKQSVSCILREIADIEEEAYLLLKEVK